MEVWALQSAIVVSFKFDLDPHMHVLFSRGI